MMLVVQRKYFLFFILLLLLGLFAFGTVSAEEDMVIYEEDVILDLIYLPLETFKVASGSMAEIVEYDGDTLRAKNIPVGASFKIVAEGYTVVEVEATTEDIELFEFSSYKASVTTESILEFGGYPYWPIQNFGATGILDLDYYISNGSKAQSILLTKPRLEVFGIPDGEYFALRNASFTALKMTPDGGTADLDILHSDFRGDPGHMEKWTVNSLASVDFEVAVYSFTEVHPAYPPYNVFLDDVEITDSPQPSLLDVEENKPKIYFTNTGSGEYSFFHWGLVVYEEDIILELQNLTSDTFKIATGSMAEAAEYVGDTLTVKNIPAGTTFKIVAEGYTVVEVEATTEDIELFEFSAYHASVTTQSILEFGGYPYWPHRAGMTLMESNYDIMDGSQAQTLSYDNNEMIMTGIPIGEYFGIMSGEDTVLQTRITDEVINSFVFSFYEATVSESVIDFAGYFHWPYRVPTTLMRPFQITSSSAARSVEYNYTGEILSVRDIPLGDFFAMNAGGQMVVRTDATTESISLFEFSYYHASASSESVLEFGGYSQWPAGDYGTVGGYQFILTPQYHIGSGSRTQSVIWSKEKISVYGIPSEDYFSLNREGRTLLGLNPVGGTADFEVLNNDVYGSSNLINKWTTNSAVQVNYDVGVYQDYYQGVHPDWSSYNIFLNDVEIADSPQPPFLDPIEEEPRISFYNTGSGEYYVFHSGLVFYEEDVIVDLVYLPLEKFKVASGSMAASVDYINDTLTVRNIPAGTTFKIVAEGYTVVEVEATTEDIELFEFSSYKASVTTESILEFGGYPYWPIQNFGATGILAPHYYISSGSKAQSILLTKPRLEVFGIPDGEYFALRNASFTALKMTPSGDIANLDVLHSDFQGDPGNLRKWTVSSLAAVDFEVAVHHIESSYNIFLDDVEIADSPKISIFDVEEDKPKIYFTNTGSGEYSFFHWGLVVYEEDIITDISGLNPSLVYSVMSSSGVKSIEYIADVLNVGGITGIFGIKQGNDLVIKIAPQTELDAVFFTDNISGRYITEWDIITSNSLETTVAVGKTNTDYRVLVNGIIVGGGNSGENAEVVFSSSVSGTYTLEEGPYGTCIASDLMGYAWSDNIGWISFSCMNEYDPGQIGEEKLGHGVNLKRETGLLSGYAWSDNIGIITFDEELLTDCPHGDCKAVVDMNTGELSGWAKALNIGEWISLAGDIYEEAETIDHVEVFTEIGDHTWEVPEGIEEVDVLVVGGGGGGGNAYGGGGAGGVIYKTNHSVTPASEITVTVGGGGAGGAEADAWNNGADGSNSVFDDQTAVGGGGGDGGANGGNNGGSGGGSGAGTDVGEGTENQGNDGGMGSASASHYGGGGGGGKGAVGGNGTGSVAGNGGAGQDYSATFGTDYGISGVFAGGGGGSTYNGGTAGDGGTGGGGGGGDSSSGAGEAGTANTGGGGGAGFYRTSSPARRGGGAGGSGIVIVKWEEVVSGGDKIGEYGVELTGNDFHGWAWGDTLTGWISFNCANMDECGTSNYKVYLVSSEEELIVRTDRAVGTRSKLGTSTTLMGALLRTGGSSEVTVWFEWGNNPESLIKDDSTEQILDGVGRFSAEIDLGGSQFGNTFYFRAIAEVGGERSEGNIMFFTVYRSQGNIILRYLEDERGIIIKETGVMEIVK
jgi:hypothetical protein